MAVRVVYLVRHGFHDAVNRNGAKGGGDLTPLGMEQAQFLARRLARLPVTTLYSSSMPRAAQTADIVKRKLPDIPVRFTSKLWECLPSLPPQLEQHFGHVPESSLEKSRDHAEFVFETFLKPARGEDKHDVVICHGNLIRYLIGKVLGTREHRWFDMDMCNCAVSEILVKKKGQLMLISHNDVGHLPPAMVTSTITSRLANSLFLAAQDALGREKTSQALECGKESYALFRSLNHDKAPEVQRWLQELTD